MTFDVEVVVRQSGQVVQELLYHDGPQPAQWTDADARAILTAMLLAVDRAVTGSSAQPRPVLLRGLSWIVTPFEQGSAIAVEITSGSVVAGPFDIPQPALDTLVRRAIAQDTPAPS